MIFTFTDFGMDGPYLGQVKAVLWREAPGQPVFDLFADAPDRRPCESAYLLAAYAQTLPPGAHILGVVDPGVGGDRPGVALKLDGRWFVGPGNGLFEIAERRAASVQSHVIAARPELLWASFHGRDLFAPILGKLAAGAEPAAIGLEPAPQPRFHAWPDDLARVVYVDVYGNLMTGLRASSLPKGARLRLNGQTLARAGTFSDVGEGQGLWYENANGLAEIAVNRGNAATRLAAAIGSKVEII
jgi:S-adenosylmethionine hydrolase